MVQNFNYHVVTESQSECQEASLLAKRADRGGSYTKHPKLRKMNE